jgi:RimJ/RimL family protein N-acetyltransferase
VDPSLLVFLEENFQIEKICLLLGRETMTSLIREIRERLPIIWEIFEKINGFLVMIFFHARLNNVRAIIEAFDAPSDIIFKSLNQNNAEECWRFLSNLDENDIKYFHPFEFSLLSIQRVIKNGGYLLFSAERKDNIVGMFFLRIFLNGCAFLGFSVSPAMRGCGIGTAMIKAMTDATNATKLILYSTVNVDNISSMRAHNSAASLKIIERLRDGSVVMRLDGKK